MIKIQAVFNGLSKYIQKNSEILLNPPAEFDLVAFLQQSRSFSAFYQAGDTPPVALYRLVCAEEFQTPAILIGTTDSGAHLLVGARAARAMCKMSNPETVFTPTKLAGTRDFDLNSSTWVCLEPTTYVETLISKGLGFYLKSEL